MTDAAGRTLTCAALCLASAVGAYQNPYAFWILGVAALGCATIWRPETLWTLRPCPRCCAREEEC
jgi:hypothetical protein